MRVRALSSSACAAVLLSVASATEAKDFEIECKVCQGDPKGNGKPESLTNYSRATLAPKAGQPATLQVGSSILIGKQFVPVGHRISVTARDAKDGAIVVKAVLEHSQAVGPAGAQQVTSTRTESTATVQSGGRVRLELGSDPKDRHWVEITVRKVK
jgi:hypothetical protein